ncbi:TPA: MFS transporter [Listeria monocytogenes]|nr:MFS transporter [Listeria innocua]
MIRNSNRKQLKKVLSVGIVACLCYAVSAGIRSNYGIMLTSISENSELSYSSVSFTIAIGQLVFGIMQPLFGIVALRKSNRYVLLLGSILMRIGMFSIPYSHVAWTLMLTLGILLPAGTGAISFGIIIGAITPILGDKKSATVSGLVNASSGIGSSTFSILIKILLSIAGLTKTTKILTVLILSLFPIILILHKQVNITEETKNTEKQISVKNIFKKAFLNKTFLLLMLGFFTCGFHMAIIETHLYSQLISYGINESISALAFSAYGIATIVGAVISGIVSTHIKLKNILAFLYGCRAIIVIVFLIMPKVPISIFIFCIMLGVTSAATVTPTTGLISKTFGSNKLGILFGFIFFCHQIGSFISAWIGGISVEITGGYILIWCLSIGFCIVASIASFGIKEKR